MAAQQTYTVCPHDCPDTCGIITEVENGKAVKLYGNPDHPVTQGWLCAKVRPYLKRVYHPDRLRYPLKRIGPKGSNRWRRITWGEALTEIGERWQTIVAKYGAAAILPYSFSGTLGVVQMSVSNARFWNRLGASRLERSICGAAAKAAVEATLGARRNPPYADVLNSRLILIWGNNPVSSGPHFMTYLNHAQKAGAQVIVIDPYRSKTARGADWHLAPRPATDGALALGMAHVIAAENLYNESWLNAHTIGWRQFQALLKAYSPERVAAITGLAKEDIIKLARLYAHMRPGLIKIADGLQRNLNGGQAVRAIAALPALTGQYGQPGGGLFYSASGAIKWDKQVLHRWEACPPPARVVNMNRLGAALLGEVGNPPVMSLYVFGANPAVSAPNTGKVIQGLQREDLFTVVHELFMTDTARYADIVLPATSQLEQTDLHKPYGHTCLAYNRQAIPPLAESKSNWETMRLLSKAMGFDDPWLHQSPDEVIEELLQAAAAHTPALRGVTLERLKAEGWVAVEMGVPFSDLHFPTPSGKVELYSQTLAEQGLDPLPDYLPAEDKEAIPPGASIKESPPLILLSAAAHHFTSSTFANQADLLA
ncbi:MAG TPA: molybdopterin oxidoreductase family protein, partial [Anaerolineae bacterium]|nr:molybdopterin oxidoreductase family protein [Anaerolineae bacterium]